MPLVHPALNFRCWLALFFCVLRYYSTINSILWKTKTETKVNLKAIKVRNKGRKVANKAIETPRRRRGLPKQGGKTKGAAEVTRVKVHVAVTKAQARAAVR